MNKFAACTVLTIVLITFTSAQAQKVLSLENPVKFKRILFQPGDYIRFGTDDSQAKFSGMIEAVDDSTVVIVKTVKIENKGDATTNVFRDYVPISQITSVYEKDRNWWYFFRNMYAGTAIIGGGGLLLGTIINSIILDTPPDPSSIILASAVSASGLLIRYLGRNKYTIGKRWQLRALDPMISEEDFQ